MLFPAPIPAPFPQACHAFLSFSEAPGALLSSETRFLGISSVAHFFYLCDLNTIFLFLLNLLGCHWLIKLYRFQVHSSIIHHLYFVLCIFHFYHHLSPFYALLSPHPLPPHWQLSVCSESLSVLFILLIRVHG